jgi:hypothetical protein
MIVKNLIEWGVRYVVLDKTMILLAQEVDFREDGVVKIVGVDVTEIARKEVGLEYFKKHCDSQIEITILVSSNVSVFEFRPKLK